MYDGYRVDAVVTAEEKGFVVLWGRGGGGGEGCR